MLKEFRRDRARKVLLGAAQFIAKHDYYTEYDEDRMVYTVKTSTDYESLVESTLGLQEGTFLVEISNTGEINQKADNLSDEGVYELMFHRAYCFIINSWIDRPGTSDDISMAVRELRDEIIGDESTLEDVRNGILK